jgi:hypothetical protein
MVAAAAEGQDAGQVAFGLSFVGSGRTACEAVLLVQLKGEQPNSNAEEPRAIPLTTEKTSLPRIVQQRRLPHAWK